jgi:hypothetical protein
VGPVYYPLTSPLTDNLVDPGEDAWLAAQVEERLASGDPWQHAVAMGMCARLRQLPSAGQLVVDLLAGTDPGGVLTERRWAQNLSVDVKAELTYRLEHEAAGLLRDLQVLDAQIEDDDAPPDMDSPGWHRGLVEMLHRRDDLAGMSLLLETGVTTTLAEVDELGSLLLEAIPLSDTLADDLRLQRVAACAPEAWWGMIESG